MWIRWHSNAALGAGGYIVPADPGSPTNTSEEYNGSSWTAGGTLNLARLESAAGVVGTQTAGLLVGGRGPPFTGAVEEYNGTAWTSVTAVPQAIRAGGGAGPQTAAVVFGGQISGTPDIQTATFSYDGTSWSAAGNLGTARYSIRWSRNSNKCGLAFGRTPLLLQDKHNRRMRTLQLQLLYPQDGLVVEI